MKARIKVKDVKPGMFSRERFVSVEFYGQTYSLYVDESSLEDHNLEVLIVALSEEKALVELPRDPVNAGSRISVPRGELIFAG